MQVASPKAVRERLLEYAERPHIETTHGDRGAIIGAFEDVLLDVKGNIEDVNERRYIVWGLCFGKEDAPLEMIRSGALESGQIFALKKWVGFFKDELTDKWCTRESFCMEVRQVYEVASLFHMLDNNPLKEKGDSTTLGEWIAGLSTALYKIEKAGMVQSATEHLGGVITAPLKEPAEGYIPL